MHCLVNVNHLYEDKTGSLSPSRSQARERNQVCSAWLLWQLAQGTEMTLMLKTLVKRQRSHGKGVPDTVVRTLPCHLCGALVSGSVSDDRLWLLCC